MRAAIRTATFLVLLLCSLCNQKPLAADQPVESDTFYHDFVGLSDDQIASIRRGKAIAKILESRTPDEVFVFGSVYIKSTPERYLKLAFDIDALRKLPSYLAIREFGDPPELCIRCPTNLRLSPRNSAGSSSRRSGIHSHCGLDDFSGHRR